MNADLDLDAILELLDTDRTATTATHPQIIRELVAALREARERADRAERRVKDLERPTDRELEKSGEEWRRIGNA